MKNMLVEKFNSDKAAVGTTEIIILIALGIFAALALFTFILQPVRNSAISLGSGLQGWIGKLLGSKGTGIPEFTPGPATPGTP